MINPSVPEPVKINVTCKKCQHEAEIVLPVEELLVVALFPEGTRSLDGKLGKAEAGIGLIAIKSGVNIIPIYVSGTDKVLPRGQKHITPNKVRAKIGRPVNIEECKNISDKRKSYECVGEKVMEAIRRLRDD